MIEEFSGSALVSRRLSGGTTGASPSGGAPPHFTILPLLLLPLLPLLLGAGPAGGAAAAPRRLHPVLDAPGHILHHFLI